MQAPGEMSHTEVVRVELTVLKEEHRDLDLAITALEITGLDELSVKRLKKKKLLLKYRIKEFEDKLTPDIIA